jgi:ABC-2 type transport system permease protein
LPRISQAAWLVLAYGVVVGLYGPVLGFPDWMGDLSPFAATPMLPAESLVAGPVVILIAVAAVLFAAGFAGFQRRDIGR